MERSASDEAVSENIGVMLMLAITVVLGIALYAWISSSAEQDEGVARNAALTSANAIQTNATAHWKNYTFSAASGGLAYGHLVVTLGGAPLPCAVDEGSADSFRVWHAGGILPCQGAGAPAAIVTAGDLLEIYDHAGGLSGKTVQLLDTGANRVILSVSVL